MAGDKNAKKQKVASGIEKLEDRIAPGGIGGLVGDLGADTFNTSEKESMSDAGPGSEDLSTLPQAETDYLDKGEPDLSADELNEPQSSESDIVNEQINDDGSAIISFADGSVETHNIDGSGYVDYPDGERESWDGLGGGSFDDGQGNTVTWNADGSGSWISEDGSSGFHRADGSGGYANSDGSHGTYKAEGTFSHSDADGTLYQQSDEGDGSVTHPDGSSQALNDAEGDWTIIGQDHGAVVDEQVNEDGSGTVSYADGTVEIWHSDGSGSITYPDGSSETWDGEGGGVFNDGEGNTYQWNADGSGQWVSADGSSGSFNADGSGNYQNADGGYGTWEADGSGTHTEPDGTRWTYNADGSGSIVYPDGYSENWESDRGFAQQTGFGELTEEFLNDIQTEGTQIEGNLPPDPNGAVNEFIAPLFAGGFEPAEWGLDYDEEGPSSWTLPIGMDAVNSTAATFWVSGDMVGEWEGELPPEASGPDEGGNYRIQSWPLAEVIDNGDGTVTLIFDIDGMP